MEYLKGWPHEFLKIKKGIDVYVGPGKKWPTCVLKRLLSGLVFTNNIACEHGEGVKNREEQVGLELLGTTCRYFPSSPFLFQKKCSPL